MQIVFSKFLSILLISYPNNWWYFMIHYIYVTICFASLMPARGRKSFCKKRLLRNADLDFFLNSLTFSNVTQANLRVQEKARLLMAEPRFSKFSGSCLQQDGWTETFLRKTQDRRWSVNFKFRRNANMRASSIFWRFFPSLEPNIATSPQPKEDPDQPFAPHPASTNYQQHYLSVHSFLLF